MSNRNRNVTGASKNPVYRSSLIETEQAALPVNASVSLEVSSRERGKVDWGMPVISTTLDLGPAQTGHAAGKSQAPYRPIASLGRIAVGLTMVVVFPVLAQTHFVPSPSTFAYDSGVLPSVAISGTSVVEVHQGTANGSGPLWSRTGHIQADGTVIWASKSFQYDSGGRPSVAVSGTNVLEVHEGSANGFGPLWYKTGQIQADGSVAWNSNGHQYDNGAKPSIAISGNDVIEVHQGSADAFGALWYKTGRILPNGSVAWSANGYPYDSGGAPRVAMSGPNIIEVHQGTANIYGPLWYKTGQFQADASVRWSATANYYDNGSRPSVSLDGATILEIHEGSANVLGSLWFHAGLIQADGSVTWDPLGTLYDRIGGGAPSIALAGAVALEVHQGSVGFGLEWYRTFRY
jgi:hypothetical protein